MMKQLINEMNIEFRETGQSLGKTGIRKYSLFFILLLTIGIPTITFSAPPPPPSGLCFQTEDGTIQCAADNLFAPPTFPTVQTGVFPGTNVKFRPGFVIAASENESPATLESKWQQFFTSSPNRKVSYRPPGIYGGMLLRLNWDRFYTNINVRPKDPKDHKDPAYDWTRLDNVFAINAVQNEDALILLQVRDIGNGVFYPNWLANTPYNGTFKTTNLSGTNTRYAPKYYRFAGPDLRGLTNQGASPPIAEEFIYFIGALYNHLVATGNINKLMGLDFEEAAGVGGGTGEPADLNKTDAFHGFMMTRKFAAEIFAKSGIPVYQRSMYAYGDNTAIMWAYAAAAGINVSYPDMKLTDTSSVQTGRFTDYNTGVYQKDLRAVMEGTEVNGQRDSTYFAPGIANPWNYSSEKVPQTASHVLWALSGSPKGVNKDSGLGQKGEDPPGVMPAHTIIIGWGNQKPYSPSLEDWHKAVDTFGPPGTFAFPYFPKGYNP